MVYFLRFSICSFLHWAVGPPRPRCLCNRGLMSVSTHWIFGGALLELTYQSGFYHLSIMYTSTDLLCFSWLFKIRQWELYFVWRCDLSAVAEETSYKCIALVLLKRYCIFLWLSVFYLHENNKKLLDALSHSQLATSSVVIVRFDSFSYFVIFLI